MHTYAMPLEKLPPTCHIVDWETAGEHLGRAVVALGVFDGVHVGHQELLRHTVHLAREQGIPAVVMTFDRDPELLLLGDSAPAQLLTLSEKKRFIAETGVDTIIIVGFSHQIAEMSPFRFVTEVLLHTLEPSAVVVGRNFHFGHKAEGNVDTLHQLGAGRNFTVVPHELLEVEGAPVSSTRIRGLIAEGDVAAAARLLGRGHRLAGTVMRGRGQGRELGVPTANVAPLPHSAIPADGVYAGRFIVHGKPWPAAIAVGKPPTFEDAEPFVECHLIGFDGDLYGLEVEVEFDERLRAQRRFESLEELTAQMHADIARAGELLGGG